MYQDIKSWLFDLSKQAIGIYISESEFWLQESPTVDEHIWCLLLF